MSKHISIAIGANEVSALWIKSGVVRWYGHVPLPNDDALESALRALLESVPRGRSQLRATVVLSPHWVQTRQLHGLPAVGSSRLAAQLVRENERSFFLWHGCPATIVAQFGRDGVAWGAAYDAEFLDAVLRAAQTARLRILDIAPSVVAIAAAFPNERIVWSDGDHVFEIQGARDGLTRLQRVFQHSPADSTPVPALLKSIGADADRFLPAYAAASGLRRAPLGWRPRADPARLRRQRRLLNAAACIALLMAGAAAELAPAVRSMISSRASQRELQRWDATRRDLASTNAELRRVSDALDRAARFAADRGAVTRTLAELSDAAPESTAILDMHVDSVEGSFTAIAPHVAELLPALMTTEGISAPQITGSVSRQTIAGARLERASFRFRRPRAARSSVR